MTNNFSTFIIYYFCFSDHLPSLKRIFIFFYSNSLYITILLNTFMLFRNNLYSYSSIFRNNFLSSLKIVFIFHVFLKIFFEFYLRSFSLSFFVTFLLEWVIRLFECFCPAEAWVPSFDHYKISNFVRCSSSGASQSQNF